MAHQARRLRETLQSSKALANPVLGRLGLGRLSGHLPHERFNAGEEVASYYAASLSFATALPAFGASELAIDEQTGDLFLPAVYNDSVYTLYHFLKPSDCSSHLYDYQYRLCVTPLAGAVSSLLVTPQPQGFIFWTSHSNGSTPARIHVARKSQVEAPNVHTNDHSHCSHAYAAATTYQIPECDVWDIAASPLGTRVAAACTDGLRVFEDPLYGTHRHLRNAQEPMVVAFKEESIAITGTRAGAVGLRDLRSASGTTTRLRHGSAVTAIRAINESHLLVRGLQTVSLPSVCRIIDSASKDMAALGLAFTVPPKQHSWSLSLT